MEGLSDQTKHELDETIEHLNANHADSVLMLVRHGVGQPAAVDAEIKAIDPEGADVIFKVGRGYQPGRLKWSQLIGSRPDVQREIFATLSAARRTADAAVPLTSLEVEQATRPILPTLATEVVAVTDLSPNMRKIEFEGGLESFESAGGDQFVYVMVPRRSSQSIPAGWRMSDHRAAGTDSPFFGAYYTVRSWDPMVGRMAVWFVVHGHPSGVGAWAAECQPGDRVALWGPRHGFGTGHRGRNYLFVSDESGLAAVASLLESLPQSVQATVFAETIDEGHVVPLPRQGISWLYRGNQPAGGNLLYDAVRSTNLDTSGLVAWGAGESRLMTRIRKYLRNDRGMPATSLYMTSYWRRSM